MAVAQPFVIKGESVQNSADFYIDRTGKFISGTWQCDAFESVSRPFPYYQFSVVQEGSITLIDDAGEAHVFTTGDAFFVPKGVVCSGRSVASVRLFYAVLHSTN